MKNKITFFVIGVAVFGLFTLGFSYYLRLWGAELLLSIAPQFLIVVVLLLLASVCVAAFQSNLQIQQKYAMATAVLALSAVGVFTTLPSLAAQQLLSGNSLEKFPITFATFNKQHSNTDYRRIAAYLQSNNIDIAAFQETSPKEIDAIRDISQYGYSAAATSTDISAHPTVGIVSRLPVISSSSALVHDGYAVLRSEIEVTAQQRVAFYSAHIEPPFSNDMYHRGSQNVDLFAKLIAADPLPVVAGGDFNTTIYSPKLRQFNKLIEKTVKTTTTAIRPECSWFGYGSLACMRIDHIYVPNTSQIHNVTISSSMGSDHRMVIAELSP